MKSKRGYKHQKTEVSTGRWLKRYFVTRTTRKYKSEEEYCPVCGHYCLGKGVKSMGNKTASTYVRYGNDWFWVSTINRESSAQLAPYSVYAETIVWKWNPQARKREGILLQDEDMEDSIATHLKHVKGLYEHGWEWLDEGDE